MVWGLLLAENGANMCLAVLPQGHKKRAPLCPEES